MKNNTDNLTEDLSAEERDLSCLLGRVDDPETRGSDRLASTRILIHQLCALPPPQPSELLHPRIVSAAARPPRSYPRAPLLKIAAAILLMASSLLLLRPSGTPAQEATQKALGWLAAQQDPSGYWNPARQEGHEAYRIGVTGLSLLALQEGAATAHSDTVARGIDWLCLQQQSDGHFGTRGRDALYNHSIATCALLERYATSEDPALRPVISQALEWITYRQHPRGGWGYASEPAGGYSYLAADAQPPNSILSAWPCQALLRARELDWPQGGQALKEFAQWNQRLIDAQGWIGYRRPGDFPYGNATLQAVGLLLKEQLSPEGSPLAQAAQPDNPPPDYYRDYYRAQVLHDDAATSLQNDLLSAQVRSGPSAGSWNPSDRWGQAGGRLYATAMATLALNSAP